MRSPGAMLIVLLILAGCHAREETAAIGRDCTKIVSAVERLACFDAAAGTPPTVAEPSPGHAAATVPASAAAPAAAVASGRASTIAGLVRRNEAARQTADNRFLLSRSDDPQQPGQPQIVISAPALGQAASRPILAISCLSSISRLQLVVAQPINRNQMSIRLLLDGRPLAAAKPWQVLEEGNIVDAGRGLVAIGLLQSLGAGARLQIESDYVPFDGLVFDASGLHEQILQQREACHW